MTCKTAEVQIAVIGPKGERATVIAVPHPSSSDTTTPKRDWYTASADSWSTGSPRSNIATFKARSGLSTSMLLVANFELGVMAQNVQLRLHETRVCFAAGRR